MYSWLGARPRYKIGNNVDGLIIVFTLDWLNLTTWDLITLNRYTDLDVVDTFGKPGYKGFLRVHLAASSLG